MKDSKVGTCIVRLEMMANRLMQMRATPCVQLGQKRRRICCEVFERHRNQRGLGFKMQQKRVGEDNFLKTVPQNAFFVSV